MGAIWAHSEVKIGDRIELVLMTDDPNPVEPGTRGTVDYVTELEDLGYTQISVIWDNGRTLGLCYPPDRFRILKAPDLASLSTS